jgi:hypothetical protein
MSFYQNENRRDQSGNLNVKSEFRIVPTSRRGLRARSSGLRLMTTISDSMPSAFGFVPFASGPNLPVQGSGTVGRLARWTGLTSSNSFIGDSIIFESKFGLVGIGTDAPTSKLTVQGMIETTLGGIKFPDGTVQTTSASGALFSVAHDSTLTGDGTISSPLGVAIPLTLVGSIAVDAIITGSNQIGGVGVRGISTTSAGVKGETTSGAGVHGFSLDSGVGVLGTSSQGIGIQGFGGTGFGFGSDGIVGQGGPATEEDGQGSAGIRGTGGEVPGKFGLGGFGVVGRGGAAAIPGTGVVGEGGGSSGTSSGGDGVEGFGGAGTERGGNGLIGGGGDAFGSGGVGGDGLVSARGSGQGSGASDGLAGRFIGQVMIDGDLDVTGTKNFKIDHPLDPENKYLVHAAIESSEVLNVYSGNVTTDLNGDAMVNLPAWFDSLNKDLRYQLTVIGTFAQAIVASEVQNNRFIIKTSAPAVKVSWQVTGVRCDAGMKTNPFTAERVKPHHEQGTYLNPEAYGQPQERSLNWTRHPQLMRKIRQTGQRAKTK